MWRESLEVDEILNRKEAESSIAHSTTVHEHCRHHRERSVYVVLRKRVVVATLQAFRHADGGVAARLGKASERRC